MSTNPAAKKEMMEKASLDIRLPSDEMHRHAEYAPEDMKKNGAEVIHLATGLVVGYPPCPYIDHFCQLIEKHHGMKAVIGTHPIPQKYFLTHQALGTWDSVEWKERIKHVLEDETVRLRYN